jgi:AAA15 family ATPase/GTPase
MLIEFTVENFRSIKKRQVFSLVAEKSILKNNNVFEVTLPNSSPVRLLKTALIYGANASGKSNFIRALGCLTQLILRRPRSAGNGVRGYDPFRFSNQLSPSPTFFEIVFILNGNKYRYQISFNDAEIQTEELDYYPKGHPQNVFTRISDTGHPLHKIKLGKNFGNKEVQIFDNQAGLNKFGTDIPDEFLTQVYTFFNSLDVNSALKPSSDFVQMSRTAKHLHLSNQEKIFKRLANLIRAAGTQIEKVDITDVERRIVRSVIVDENGDTPVRIQRIDHKVYGVHNVFEDGKFIGSTSLEFEEESEGTKALFWRGGLILEKLENGGILVFDELDNSLHPKLAKFLVMLFTNPKTNPKNAQLIFATHEVTLLDRDLFRTDQIWFTEKNEFGETELYSAQDFDGVREDVPFDKWYMAGKFGGLPKIEDIESIFNHE